MAIEAFGPDLVDGKEVFGPNLLPLVVIGEVFGPMYVGGAEVFGPTTSIPEPTPDVITTGRVVVLPIRLNVITLRGT